MQVREAIGVALCIVCSNLRLFSSHFQYPERSGTPELSGCDDLALSFKVHAFELTGKIQNFSPSENPVSTGDVTNENASADMKLNADVRKMETVIIQIMSYTRCTTPFLHADSIH